MHRLYAENSRMNERSFQTFWSHLSLSTTSAVSLRIPVVPSLLIPYSDEVDEVETRVLRGCDSSRCQELPSLCVALSHSIRRDSLGMRVFSDLCGALCVLVPFLRRRGRPAHVAGRARVSNRDSVTVTILFPLLINVEIMISCIFLFISFLDGPQEALSLQ